MERIAVHAVDNLLPRVPLRQWVLSLPKCLRPALQNNVELNHAVLHIITDVISNALHHACVPILSAVALTDPSPGRVELHQQR